MTSDQDPTSRPANPTTPDNPSGNPAIDDRAAALGDAGGAPAVTGRARNEWPTATLGALAISLISLVVAITSPLWSPAIYGSPDLARFMVLGVAQLRPALAVNEPFRNELTLVRRVMPSQPDVNAALETLAAYADKGVPTLAELQASFVKSANAIVLKDVVGTKPNQFDRAVIAAAAMLHLHALAHWLDNNLPVAAMPGSAIVWEAKKRLDAGDLAGASAALGRLTGPEAKIAEPWITAVQSRIAANQVLELLETVSQSQVGSVARPGSPAQRS
jgi:hypothetical protein